VDTWTLFSILYFGKLEYLGCSCVAKRGGSTPGDTFTGRHYGICCYGQ